MKNKEMAKLAALTAEDALSKETSSNRRFCVASGDPHFTNYNGEVFHLQRPGMFTVAKSPDDSFEVQEKMKQHGNNIWIGRPSCIAGLAARYRATKIELSVDSTFF